MVTNTSKHYDAPYIQRMWEKYGKVVILALKQLEFNSNKVIKTIEIDQHISTQMWETLPSLHLRLENPHYIIIDTNGQQNQCTWLHFQPKPGCIVQSVARYSAIIPYSSQTSIQIGLSKNRV
jgi:hypothetical protein